MISLLLGSGGCSRFPENSGMGENYFSMRWGPEPVGLWHGSQKGLSSWFSISHENSATLSPPQAELGKPSGSSAQGPIHCYICNCWPRTPRRRGGMYTTPGCREGALAWKWGPTVSGPVQQPVTQRQY